MMKLAVLVDGLLHKQVSGTLELAITGITYHSGRVRSGDLFVCLPGTRSHGIEFVHEAVLNGAVAVVTDLSELKTDATVIYVPDTRVALALLSARFYRYPARELVLIGVTGTNGKTTVTHLIDALLQFKGAKTGLIGTVGYRVGEDDYPSLATTPEANDLQKLLRKMVDSGATHATMEVSSHALAWHRTVGCDFDIVVLTNITEDHLDFHRTFAHYLASKSRLFSWLGSHPTKQERPKRAIINGDDGQWQHIMSQTPVEALLYGVGEHCHVRAENIIITAEGVSYDLHSPFGRTHMKLKLTGMFSVYNSLAAACVGLLEGILLEDVRDVLCQVKGVPGRFEPVDEGQDFSVIVDYAHTPDGLDNVLRTVREFSKAKVITVFGCGGERDRTKRPLMGEAAAKYSDYCIITSDNPRGEDPQSIIDEVIPGVLRFSDESKFCVLLDRYKAIEKAINLAKKDDVVVIAGKGHETTQVFQDHTINFDDRLVAREIIRRRIKEHGDDM